MQLVMLRYNAKLKRMTPFQFGFSDRKSFNRIYLADFALAMMADRQDFHFSQKNVKRE